MKKARAILSIILILAGCTPDNLPIDEETVSIEEKKYIPDFSRNNQADPLKNYPNIDENLKTQLRELYRLWNQFDDAKSQDIDPTEAFHNSEYITEFKKFLSNRESLAVSDNAMRRILEQNGLESMDKEIFLSYGEEYNIRVISYNVDYYVQAITDSVGLRNKWIFVQCWNDDEFYFTTLSDGSIHAAHDFFPLEIDGVFHIVLAGTSFPYYPQPPFLWAWHLEADGFKQSSLFAFQAIETDGYFIYDSIDFDKNHCLLKWTFQTDGAFIALEKSVMYEGGTWPDYNNIACEAKDDGRIFAFTSLGSRGEIDATIQLSLVNGRFSIE